MADVADPEFAGHARQRAAEGAASALAISQIVCGSPLAMLYACSLPG